MNESPKTDPSRGALFVFDPPSSASLVTEPEDAEPRTRSWFGVVFCIVFVALNLFILRSAWLDRSWGAFGLAVMLGPIANGLLALAGLLAIPVRRKRPEFSLAWHLALCLGAPVTAIVLDAVAIFSMDLSGC